MEDCRYCLVKMICYKNLSSEGSFLIEYEQLDVQSSNISINVQENTKEGTLVPSYGLDYSYDDGDDYSNMYDVLPPQWNGTNKKNTLGSRNAFLGNVSKKNELKSGDKALRTFNNITFYKQSNKAQTETQKPSKKSEEEVSKEAPFVTPNDLQTSFSVTHKIKNTTKATKKPISNIHSPSTFPDNNNDETPLTESYESHTYQNKATNYFSTRVYPYDGTTTKSDILKRINFNETSLKARHIRNENTTVNKLPNIFFNSLKHARVFPMIKNFTCSSSYCKKVIASCYCKAFPRNQNECVLLAFCPQNIRSRSTGNKVKSNTTEIQSLQEGKGLKFNANRPKDCKNEEVCRRYSSISFRKKICGKEFGYCFIETRYIVKNPNQSTKCILYIVCESSLKRIQSLP
ncbi:uncharacterized protein [Lepeophtheirus salmonis]|uniref:uncharacterized protein isoform X1 n=2 Tax=Lepeophtheirus salmonis TaxID=72036 RepID=UPI003AF3B084